MLEGDFAARVRTARGQARLSVAQANGALFGHGYIENIESGVTTGLDMSAVARVAEAVHCFASQIDSRFDEELNQTGANFAKLMNAKGLDLRSSKTIWDRAFSGRRYRGVMTPEDWQRVLDETERQSGMDEFLR